MVHPAPYTDDRSYYECRNCGHREVADALGRCPECDGRTRNIAVARE